MQPSRRTLTVNTTLPPLAHAALQVLAERAARGGRPKVGRILEALIFAEVDRLLPPGSWSDVHAAAAERETPVNQSEAAADVLRKALGLPPRPMGGSSAIQDIDCPTSSPPRSIADRWAAMSPEERRRVGSRPVSEGLVAETVRVSPDPDATPEDIAALNRGARSMVAQLGAIAACPLRVHHAKLNGRACPGGCGA